MAARRGANQSRGTKRTRAELDGDEDVTAPTRAELDGDKQDRKVDPVFLNALMLKMNCPSNRKAMLQSGFEEAFRLGMASVFMMLNTFNVLDTSTDEYKEFVDFAADEMMPEFFEQEHEDTVAGCGVYKKIRLAWTSEQQAINAELEARGAAGQAASPLVTNTIGDLVAAFASVPKTRMVAARNHFRDIASNANKLMEADVMDPVFKQLGLDNVLKQLKDASAVAHPTYAAYGKSKVTCMETAAGHFWKLLRLDQAITPSFVSPSSSMSVPVDDDKASKLAAADPAKHAVGNDTESEDDSARAHTSPFGEESGEPLDDPDDVFRLFVQANWDIVRESMHQTWGGTDEPMSWPTPPKQACRVCQNAHADPGAFLRHPCVQVMNAFHLAETDYEPLP